MGKSCFSLITLTISIMFLLFNIMSLYGWLPEFIGNISEILLIISINYPSLFNLPVYSCVFYID